MRKLFLMFAVTALLLSGCMFGTPLSPAPEKAGLADPVEPLVMGAGQDVVIVQSEERMTLQTLPTPPLADYDLIGWYDQEHMLSYRRDSTGRRLGVGFYELATAVYSECFTFDTPDHVFSVLGFNQYYLFFEQSCDNWSSRDVCLLDLESGEISFVLRDAPYHVLWENSTLLLENDFYFDNFVLDADNKPLPSLYVYHIDIGQLELLMTECQNPIFFQEEILCFLPDTEGQYTRLEAINGDYKSASEPYLAEIAATPQALFVIVGEEMREGAAPLRRVLDVTHDRELYSTEELIYDLEGGERFLCWRNYNSGHPAQPLLYDLKTEELLVFSGPEFSGEYKFYLQGDQGLLQVIRSYEAADWSLYRFSLRPTVLQ